MPLDRAIGVVNYQPGGGGKIENLLIRGRDAGVLGIAVGDRFPAALKVKEVVIHQGGRGIAGSFSDLTVEQTKVADMLWHGVALAQPKGKILFSDFVAELCAGIGIYVSEPLGGCWFLKSTFGLNSKGGLVVFGALTNAVYVTQCYFYANNYAGIRLKEVEFAADLSQPHQTDFAEAGRWKVRRRACSGMLAACIRLPGWDQLRAGLASTGDCG